MWFLSFFLFVSAFIQAEPAPLKYKTEGTNRIGHIIIDDRTTGISQATWVYVRDALEYYKTTYPEFIILELNTPGGEVFAAQKMSDALKEMDTQFDIPVVAYINNWAISAGAMLAYSCRYIATVKDGTMGAAEPVLQGETGKQESASEKINSAIRSDFASRASFFDRNPYIAEAMVDKDIILVQRDGDIIRLDYETEIKPTDKLISPKGKLLTLTSKEMMEYKVADFLVLPTKFESLTAKEKETGVYPAAKSGLFSIPFFKNIPNAEIDAYRMDWKGTFFSWLAHPMVQSILFLGLMMGLYMEFSNPGFGLPGTVAVTSLILIVMSSFSQEIAGFLDVVLLLVGLAIIIVDLMILPTFGLLGIIGVLFMLGGLFGVMLPGLKEFNFDYDTQTLNAAGESALRYFAWIAGAFVVGLIMMLALAKWFLPQFKGFQKFVSSGDQEGWNIAEDPKKLPAPGTKGVAITPLRPSGKVEIEGVIYDAITSGLFIEQGDPIEFLRTESSALVVNIDWKSKK